MNEVRTFHAPNLDLGALAQSLSDWFRYQKYDVQTVTLPDGVVLQARQYEGWRSAMGVSSALNTVMRPKGEDLVVEMGAGKWGDKAVAGTVGLFLLWPLAFTAAYGAWQQSKLPERVFGFIQQYISSGGVVAGPGAFQGAPQPAPPVPAAVAAPTAAAPTPTPASVPTTPPTGAFGFCSKCGSPLTEGAAFCAKCGNKVA